VPAADNKATGLVGGAVAGAVVSGTFAVIGSATDYTISKEVDCDQRHSKIIRKPPYDGNRR
jgi:hypothetical protein